MVAARFEAHDIPASLVRQVLDDAGEGLLAAADRSTASGWSDGFAGPVGVALLAHELSVYARDLASRAAEARGAAVNGLLEDYSAVTVAEHLGVSRQAVYEIASRGPLAALIEKLGRPL